VAIEHFSALVDHAPGFAEGYNARATAYFQAGYYGLALEDIRQALALNPRHFGAMSGLALILEEIGEAEGALEAWRAVEALNPSRQGVREAIERLERQVEGVTL
jgi:tetratricopeptide (TPR) repeat protein